MKLVDNIFLEECILKISLQDEASLEMLYLKTKTDVFKLSYSILRNIVDAEDVMQDVYINIYKYAYLYQKKNKPMAWIFTITKNLCFKHLEKKQRTENFSLEEIDTILSKNAKDKHFDRILFKSLFESLTTEEKQIIILSSIKGFKFYEIAELLNLKLSTVLSKYHRAIKKIKLEYKEV